METSVLFISKKIKVWALHSDRLLNMTEQGSQKRSFIKTFCIEPLDKKRNPYFVEFVGLTCFRKDGLLLFGTNPNSNRLSDKDKHLY